jgi:aspartate/methionine/tyrosine aminotransferase
MHNDYKIYSPLAMDEIMNIFVNHQHDSLEPLNLGKGSSTFNVFDYVDIHLTSTKLAAHTAYGDINGLESLREAICRYYQEKFDYDLSPSRICITDGASGALTIAIGLLVETGDEILLPECCFPLYKIFTHLFGAQYRLIPLNENNCVDVEQLAKLVSAKTKAIIINSPSNPHGAVLSAEELEFISRLGIPVIFDEVYQSLSLNDAPIPSAISLSDQHFIVNSFSKSLAIAGFRLGYLIVPEKQIQLMTNAKANMNMCTSLPSQLLGEALLSHWDYLVANHRNMLINNWKIFKQASDEFGLKLLSHPKAGFFTIVDISETRQDSMTVATNLAKHFAMSTAPSIDFQNAKLDFLRLNFACPSEQIKPALQRLSAYINKKGV